MQHKHSELLIKRLTILQTCWEDLSIAFFSGHYLEGLPAS